MPHGSTPSGANSSEAPSSTTRSARAMRPEVPFRPSASARARAYDVMNEQTRATKTAASASSWPSRANTRAIAASTTPSAMRSKVESMKAPRGPSSPFERAIAPSKMSRTEPSRKAMPAAIHWLS